MHMIKRMAASIILSAVVLGGAIAQAQTSTQQWKGKFEQLDQALPTPNGYRTGSGSPGPNYWQQRADYVINVEVDDNTQLLTEVSYCKPMGVCFLGAVVTEFSFELGAAVFTGGH